LENKKRKLIHDVSYIINQKTSETPSDTRSKDKARKKNYKLNITNKI
jgi:hypothetical protein